MLPKHDEEEGTNSEKIDESCEQTASDEPSGMASSSSTSSSAILLPAPRRKKVKQNRVANPAWRTKEESSVLSSALAEKTKARRYEAEPNHAQAIRRRRLLHRQTSMYIRPVISSSDRV